MLSSELFRAALSRFPNGVTVVTARDRGGVDYGMTVSSFCSLSLVPPLVLICIERTTQLHLALQQATHFAVNVLAEEQEELAERFADSERTRLDGAGFARGLTGSALLEGTLASYECAIRERVMGGDHTIVIGEVIAVSARDGTPLVHHRGAYTHLDPLT